MSLLLIIQKAPDSVVVTESSKSIGDEGATIGRGMDNSWVLDDPERYLSNVHCEISCEGGQYYLIDRSTNGTFYNDSSDPIGKGEKLPLRVNDSFILGDYEFLVSNIGQAADSIMGASAGASDPFGIEDHAASSMSVDDIFASPGSSQPLIEDAFTDNTPEPFGFGSDAGSSFENDLLEMDPLAALNKAQGDSDDITPIGKHFDASPDPFASSPQIVDQVDPLNQQISWPEAPVDNSLGSASAIPDDWDDDFLSPAADDKGSEASLDQSAGYFEEKPPVKPVPAVEIPVATPPVSNDVIPPHPVKPRTVDRTFIKAMGLDDARLDDAEIARINQMAGQVFREMIKGVMQVLASRNAVKNEFRMNVTTIQPRENNPLKFSVNVNDALENMFIKQGDAYQKPLEAVRDGFESIAEHQLSILAGIRQAFQGVTEHFAPKHLEELFSKKNKGSLLPVSHKAKNWESYVEYFNEVATDMDKSFKILYWDGFVQAYEEQLKKLTVARKAKNFQDG